MSDDTAPAAPAGWYPTADGGQRYWDGTTWLDVPAPPTVDEPGEPLVETPEAASAASVLRSQGERRGLRTLWVVLAVVAVVVVGLIVYGLSRPKTPSLQAAYDACAPDTSKTATGDSGVHLEDDGATLTVDTKGQEDIVGASVVDLACVLAATSAPASVTANMDSTRALDGTQTATWDGITATWRYHPDNGFELVLTTN